MAAEQKKAIGRRIRQLRKAKQWNQGQLAEHIPDPKVDAQYVSKWERGVYQPQKHLEALAAALGTTEGDILAGAHDEQRGPTPDVLGDLSSPELARLSAAVEQLRTEMEALRNELLSELAEVRAAQGAEQSHPATAERSRAASAE